MRDFTLGTVLGLTPGIAGVALLTDRIKATINNPDITTVLLLVLVVFGMLGLGYLISRHIRHHHSDI